MRNPEIIERYKNGFSEKKISKQPNRRIEKLNKKLLYDMNTMENELITPLTPK